jgi:hypothetical protein
MISKPIYKGVVFILVLVLIGCKDKDNPVLTNANLHITIKSKAGNNPISKAFIFLNDSLYGKTDSKGIYSLDSISPGIYTLTCSVINFRDTTLEINITAGNTTQLNFSLVADTSFGKVFGEFQDVAIFEQKSIDKPVIKTWDELQIYDGVTGATMYKIGYPDPIPPRTVSLGDSIISVSDGFGQYYLKIQCGTYLITGACEGYTSSSKIIKVLKDSKTYANFYLEKNK